MLRDAAEKLSDKLLIIGMNLIATKKFRTQVQHQIHNLEQQSKLHMGIDAFRKEHQEFEERIKEFVECKISNIDAKVER